jgi:hypothetical protein
LRYSGYRPTRWFQLEEARGATLRRVGILLVAIVALSGFLGGVTYDSFQAATTEERIQTATTGVLEEQNEARLLSLEVERSSGVVFRHPEAVVVTVGVTDGDPPALTSDIDAEIERVVDREIRTEVRYVRVASA